MADLLDNYPNSPLRPVLKKLCLGSEEEAKQARRELGDLRDYAPPEEEALRLLRVATEAELPPPENPWDDPRDALLELLWNAPHLALVEPVEQSYAELGEDDDRLRTTLLTLLASTRTRAGAQTFVRLIAEHGWPKRAYPRLFAELAGNERYVESLFPKLLELADQYLVDVGGIALRWLQNETLSPERLAPLAPQLVSRLHALLDKARTYESSGIAWRFDEAYHGVRSRAGFLLDFLGWFDAPEVVAALERSTESADPWLALFGVTSLLRLGHDVEDDAIERVAATHETRGYLWQYLENLGELHRYPNEWADLEDFAAFDIVQWLKYPMELGREPEELELMEALETDSDGERMVLCVWRFTDDEGDWFAATSGPYQMDAVGPMAGESTFSRFEPWAARTPLGHAGAVLENLEAWRAAHADDGEPE